jgi:hypothetical protein
MSDPADAFQRIRELVEGPGDAWARRRLSDMSLGLSCEIASVQERQSATTNWHRSPWSKVRVRIAAIIPAVLAVALYLVNNLRVLHAWFAAPDGYVPMGIDRGEDAALYITWIRGLAHQWTIPNYHAAWRTEPGMALPAMTALAKLCSWSGVSAVAALHAFQLSAYVLTAYAGAFALRTFCDDRREKFAAIIGAIACVPVSAVLQFPAMFLHRPGWQLLGAGEFLEGTDGFFRGITDWPLLTFGAFTVVLALGLTARYLLTNNRKWLWFLAADCFLSAFMHPFEIFGIATAVAILFLRFRSERWPDAALEVGTIGAASLAGMGIYIAQTLRHPWIRELSSRNHVADLPTHLLPALGIPVLIGILLLLLGFPRQGDIKASIIKVWFVVTLLVAYAPKVPWSLHVFDGFYFVVGLLVMYQARDVVQSWRLSSYVNKRTVAVGACMLGVMIAPHFTFRRMAWSDGVRTTMSTRPAFFSAIAPRDESLLIEWFRENSIPDSLVLASPDQAPWIATAPIHSFGAHWLSSLLTPLEQKTWEAFYSGKLPARDASAFLAKYGFSFVVIPGKNPAIEYVRSGGQLAARIGDFEIFELPNGGMRERAAIYGDR